MSIRHALEALLADEPRSASQLQQDYADATAHVWPLNIGQVTQTLARLQRDGLAESAGQQTGPSGHTSELYQLTEAGRADLESWWSNATAAAVTGRDELVTKVTFAAARADVDLIELLDTQRAAVMADLRELNRRARTLPSSRRTDRLLVERRIFDLEAQARWLDRVEALTESEKS
ncbi:PadR family transcriptional regulator [Corynebacterium doosanense]|uniref:ParR family transcriptional regulator n=1 Tax=Corynebacterium doosanense CAU 212 = DSM 45436 TaxID=558173 RepID=A0A097IEI3_9CORY|nr:PadR family transcriptional regulator [Corynebacterium doosanense]AIT60543.1 ParR family transcriptional regulator [Corynebacterium doosanense CAU 212 = DSM 45436]